MWLTISFMLALLVFAPIASAQSSSSTQYAAYSITGVMASPSFSGITINETVSPSSTSGMSDWTVHVSAGPMNTSYTRTVNSSLILFPYLPNLPNRTFAYHNQFSNYSLNVNATKTGNGTVTLNGNSYTVTNYTFNATVTQHRYWMSVFGNASVFPSGLLYSVAFNDSLGQSLAVMLIGTNLPVNSSLVSSTTSTSSQTTTTTSMTAAMIGGAAVILIGIGAFIAVSRRKSVSQGTGGANRNPINYQ